MQILRVSQLAELLADEHETVLATKREEYPIGSPKRSSLTIPEDVPMTSILREAYPPLFECWDLKENPPASIGCNSRGVPLDGNSPHMPDYVELREKLVGRRMYYRTKLDGCIRFRVTRAGTTGAYSPLLVDRLTTHAFIDLLSEHLSEYWRGGALDYAWAHEDFSAYREDRHYMPNGVLFYYRAGVLDYAAAAVAADIAKELHWSKEPRTALEKDVVSRIESRDIELQWGRGRLRKVSIFKRKPRKTREDRIAELRQSLQKAPEPVTGMIARLEDEIRMLKDVNPSDLDPNANEQGGDEYTEVLVPKEDTQDEAPKPPAAPEKIEPMKGLFV